MFTYKDWLVIGGVLAVFLIPTGWYGFRQYNTEKAMITPTSVMTSRGHYTTPRCLEGYKILTNDHGNMIQLLDTSGGGIPCTP